MYDTNGFHTEVVETFARGGYHAHQDRKLHGAPYLSSQVYDYSQRGARAATSECSSVSCLGWQQ